MRIPLEVIKQLVALHYPGSQYWTVLEDRSLNEPPLEDLIEQLGTNLHMLINVPTVKKTKQKHQWEAISNKHIGAVGDTPEHAVALLWIRVQLGGEEAQQQNP